VSSLERLLGALVDRHVEFIIVGGLAATVHGAARPTFDVDIVYGRSGANIQRLVDALEPFEPYLRGAPPGLPFRWTAETLSAGLNFTLTTTEGSIDLLGEVVGGGRYEALLPFTFEAAVLGVSCRCVTLRKLIELKRAAGRPRDLDALAELEALLEESEDASGRDPE
jgi:predicted nucleotidyltransferase